MEGGFEELDELSETGFDEMEVGKAPEEDLLLESGGERRWMERGRRGDGQTWDAAHAAAVGLGVAQLEGDAHEAVHQGLAGVLVELRAPRLPAHRAHVRQQAAAARRGLLAGLSRARSGRRRACSRLGSPASRGCER